MHKAWRTPLILSGAVWLILFHCSWAGSSGQARASIPATDVHAALRAGLAMPFALSSTAFADGAAIPRRYTCDGVDVSPPLRWSGIPAGTHSLALVTKDPDAPGGTWTHWIIWNIPAHTASLPEGVPAAETLQNGARQGTNSFRRIGYGGPCPPAGKPHRYFFSLYALDATLTLKPGAGPTELERAMQKHILSKAAWMGTYGR